MVDLEILRSRGITVEALKEKLAGNPLTWKTTVSSGANNDEVNRHNLWNRIRSRIMEGMNRNFEDYRIYKALDVAWEKPFQQISMTLLGEFIEKDVNSDKVYKQLEEWGLTHMITQEVDKRTGKPTGKKVFNLPIFFNVFVPLVRAYATIRWAKIMNDRNLTPFFKFEPAKMTTPNRLKCEVLTDRVEVMANQYGYYDVTKQAVLKMLHYSWCLQFPKEEWHSEEQIRYADADDVADKKLNIQGKECAEGDEIKYTAREGLRYHLPHPTRFFRDLNHGCYTYNTDSGSEFAGYWSIRRYRDLYTGNYWNKDAVSIGPNSLIEDHRTFFASVYSACTLQIPVIPKTSSNDGNTLIAQTGGGTGTLDREKQLAYLYYGTDHMDQGVLTTEYFEKLIPSENGLGDYDGPVWFRFVIAGDNATFLYAAPLPYCPIIYYGYDADESRTNNPSLSLEILPFQDQFSNVLTQIILTAKQNLANMTLVDEDVLTPEAKESILNIGETLFRKLNVFGYSGKKLLRSQGRANEAIQAHQLPKGNVAELTGVLKTILDVLERVLVMSSQEVAQSASHEQTREEVKNIAKSTSTRLLFTSKPIDIAREAWKRQLYYGLMAYGDDDFYAHIPAEMPLKKNVLEDMGFTFVDKDVSITPQDRHRRVKISKKRTAIDLWSLASTRDGDDRVSDAQTAQAMAQIVQSLMANPLTAQAIGAEQAIQITNQICQLAGLPRDFVLKDASAGQGDPAAQQAAAQQQLAQVAQTVLQQVNQGLQQEMQPLLEKTTENSKDIALMAPLITKIAQALQIQAPNPSADDLQPAEPVAGGPS